MRWGDQCSAPHRNTAGTERMCWSAHARLPHAAPVRIASATGTGVNPSRSDPQGSGVDTGGLMLGYSPAGVPGGQGSGVSGTQSTKLQRHRRVPKVPPVQTY